MWRARIAVAALALATSGFADTVWPANDAAHINRTGAWEWTRHRYAAEEALATTEDGAALAFAYEGRAVVLELDTLTPPNHYGPPERGALDIFIDGARTRTVRPRIEDREVVLHRSAAVERHDVRVVHRRDGADGVGARVRGVRVVAETTGDLTFVISGEKNGALLDVRARLRRQGRIVRTTLVRNWLTGTCRIAALPPGDDYDLELHALGWSPRRVERIVIQPGVETVLPPLYLERAADVDVDAFKFPSLGRPVVVQPGTRFRARFEAHQAEIKAVRLIRRIGPAVFSRACRYDDDRAAAFYYHREGRVEVPPATPPGLYDLEVAIVDRNEVRTLISRRCVFVVAQFSAEPVFFACGHLDTWGQYQAEYLAQLVEIANIVGPDLVLVSNEANPAYAVGALHALDMPYLINFGNHRAPEPGPWYGEPVAVLDFGSAFTVLNFGRAWDTDTTEADALLGARAETRTKIIHAFEANAPLAILDRHRVSLIHYAHGPGPAVAKLGATPTVRVGKVNSESFRIIRFAEGKPAAYTYRQHATAAWPFPRGGRAPLRRSFAPANDGAHREVSATVENDFEEDVPRARIVFVMPRGKYRVNNGTIESTADSDDGAFTEVSARIDLPAKSRQIVTIAPQAE